jgi:hypothetical protein
MAIHAKRVIGLKVPFSVPRSINRQEIDQRDLINFDPQWEVAVEAEVAVPRPRQNQKIPEAEGAAALLHKEVAAADS